jgi:murein DD-endopeptidase MepM/ murein hydrolase activator NlpD
MKILKWFLIPLLLIIITSLIFMYSRYGKGNPLRTRRVITWIKDPKSHTDWLIQAKTRCEENTPFLFPAEGYIGFLWDDSFRPGHRHQGIDIFSKDGSGITPVYAAYAGYLTRLPDWKSTLIIRIPDDPLRPGRQIWTYYTHMADGLGNSYIMEDFSAGSSEVYVEEGTLLGYMGNYSGTPGNPTGIHLHFSIVRDDGSGVFLNELKIQNTIDPSPYFDLPLNGPSNRNQIPICDP